MIVLLLLSVNSGFGKVLFSELQGIYILRIEKLPNKQRSVEKLFLKLVPNPIATKHST